MRGWLPIPRHLPTSTKQSSSPPSNPKIFYFILLVVALQHALVVAQAGESRMPALQFVGILCPFCAWLEKRCMPRTGKQLLKAACAAQVLDVLPSALSLALCYGLEVYKYVLHTFIIHYFTTTLDSL